MSRIEVEVGVRNAAFKTGLEEVRTSAKHFVGELKSMFAGAFAAGAIVSGLHNLLSKAEGIKDLAERFKIGITEIQRFSNAAHLSATSIEAVAKGIAKLKAAQASATKESGEAYNTFMKMGLSLQEIKNLTVEQLFCRVADAVANTTTETEKMQIVTALFGNHMASELIPMLEQGGERIRSLGDSLPVFSQEIVENLDRAAKEIHKFQQTLTVAFGTLINTVVMPFIRSIQTLGTLYGGYFYFMTEVTGEFVNTLKEAFSGDFSGAYQRARRFKDFMQETFQNVTQAARTEMKKIWEPPESTSSSIQPFQQHSPQISEEAIRLENQLHAERQKNERAQLDRQQKINFLQQEYNRLLAQANELTGTQKIRKFIEAEQTRGELDREKRTLLHEEEQEKKRVTEETQRMQKATAHLEAQKADELSRAQQLESSVDENNLIAQMSEPEKRAYFLQKQKKLFTKSEIAANTGDELSAIHKRTQAKQLESELRPRTKNFDPRYVLTVDSLQRIGGGGGIGNISDAAQRERERQTQLLERIVNALEHQELRSPTIPATLGP